MRSKSMKKKIKIGFVVLVFIVVSVCGVSVYRHFTAPKKESVPLETVIQNSSDLTTQKMVISDVFECTKGKIPLLTKKDFLVQYRTTVTAGFDVSEAEVEETKDKVTITIPHCTVDEDSVKIKSDDITLYDTNFAMLNVEPEALLEVLGEAETRAKKLAESDEYGFIAAADANAENVVHSLYDNIVDGRKIVVEFK